MANSFWLSLRQRMELLIIVLIVWVTGCTPMAASQFPTVTPGPSPFPSESAAPGSETRKERSPLPCSPPPAEIPEESHFGPLNGNGMIAYSHDGLRLIHPDTGQTLYLHSGLDGAFVWSPDGLRLAFLSYLRLSPCAFSFVMMADLQAGTITPLTDRPGLYSRPAWSPDGRHVAYTDAEGHLYALRVEERLARVLVEDVYVAQTIDLQGKPVDWFPPAPKWVDDEHVAYLKRNSGGQIEGIALSSINGAERRMLVAGSVWPYDGFALTPDGKRLAYAPGEEGPLRIVDLHGDERLTVQAASRPIPYERLQWSPDGSRLIGRTGLAGVVLVEVEGASVQVFDLGVLGIPGEVQSWAPDGRRLVLLDGGELSTTQLVVYDLATRQRRTLAAETRPPHGVAWNPRGAR